MATYSDTHCALNTVSRNVISNSSTKGKVIKDNGTLVDEHGELWLQETKDGWRREIDKYFWPYDPTTTNNPNQTKPPTVEQYYELVSKYRPLQN